MSAKNFQDHTKKIKISIENASGSISYFVQLFTKTQVFHEHWDCKRLEDFLTKNVGITFKNCVKRTETEEITILTNKKGKQTELHKTISGQKNISSNIIPLKNSISKEDTNSSPHTSCDTLKFYAAEKEKLHSAGRNTCAFFSDSWNYEC